MVNEFEHRLRAATGTDFEAAAARIANDAIRTPLLPFETDSRTVRLKAECLQPLGSFKIRAATNMLAGLHPAALTRGVATASAGNFAQGLALAAQRRSVPVTVHAPNTAARVKLDAVRALGAKVVIHDFADWFSIITSRETGANDGHFIHPVLEVPVVLGNATIGLEIADAWPEVDTVVVPIGGGGMATGIALALRNRGISARIVGCEIETATPLASAMAAGRPVDVERLPSFVDGIGSTRVSDAMWPLLRDLIDDVVVVSEEEARAAIRALALRNHVIAEGAGGVALAAALSPRCGGSNVVAIISGGNLDSSILCDLLLAS